MEMLRHDIGSTLGIAAAEYLQNLAMFVNALLHPVRHVFNHT